jgi:hypothetical protein
MHRLSSMRMAQRQRGHGAMRGAALGESAGSGPAAAGQNGLVTPMNAIVRIRTQYT